MQSHLALGLCLALEGQRLVGGFSEACHSSSWTHAANITGPVYYGPRIPAAAASGETSSCDNQSDEQADDGSLQRGSTFATIVKQGESGHELVLMKCLAFLFDMSDNDIIK